MVRDLKVQQYKCTVLNEFWSLLSVHNFIFNLFAAYILPNNVSIGSVHGCISLPVQSGLQRRPLSSQLYYMHQGKWCSSACVAGAKAYVECILWNSSELPTLGIIHIFISSTIKTMCMIYGFSYVCMHAFMRYVRFVVLVGCICLSDPYVCIVGLSMFLFSAYACPDWYLYTCANVA